MLNTYIKNRGYTKTIIHNNNRNQINEINWDADYDGEDANVYLTANTDGKKKQINIHLDNNDLANLLNIPSIEKPLHKRLEADFIDKKPKIYKIELPETESEEFETPSMSDNHESIEDMITSPSFLSSPSPNDNLIIPVPISEKTSDRYTLTRRKHHRRKKTHRTLPVYKLRKRTSRSKSKSRSKSTTRTNRIYI